MPCIIEEASLADLKFGDVLKRIKIPPAVFRKTRDRIPSLNQELPEILRRAYATWKAAARRYYRDRAMPPFFTPPKQLAASLQVERQLFHILSEFCLDRC